MTLPYAGAADAEAGDRDRARPDRQRYWDNPLASTELEYGRLQWRGGGMAGLKTRAYTTSTFGFVRRPEVPAPGGVPGQCAELIVPRRVANTAEILLKRTLRGVAVMGRFRDERGTIFILRLAGGWKRHDILGHIGRHLPYNMKIKVSSLTTALAERVVTREHTKALIKRVRGEKSARIKRRS